MKRQLLALAVLTVLFPRAQAEVTDVESALAALNQAFEKGDARAVETLMTADHVAVTTYYRGPLSREEQLKGLADHKLEAYKVEGMRVRMLGKDAALVRYSLTMKGTYKGKPVPARSLASAVWVRVEGRWREAFYQETPVGGK